MSDTVDRFIHGNVRVTLPVLAWFGGAFWVGNQPNNGFWDGVVWLWYVGRYIAAHLTMLSY
jgi:hypothetical protein